MYRIVLKKTRIDKEKRIKKSWIASLRKIMAEEAKLSLK